MVHLFRLHGDQPAIRFQNAVRGETGIACHQPLLRIEFIAPIGPGIRVILYGTQKQTALPILLKEAQGGCVFRSHRRFGPALRKIHFLHPVQRLPGP